MSLTLLNSKLCRQCNSYFASFYDLIAHFETTHLQDIITSEQRRKEDDTAHPNRGSGTNLPLSYFYRLFPDADPPKSIPPPPPTRLPFCIYRKRPAPGQNVDFSHVVGQGYAHPQGSARRKDDSRTAIDDDENNISEADLEEADPNDPNVSLRYKCQIPSCGKQYKNVHGVRHHMMTAHGEDKSQHPSAPTEGPQTKNGRPFKCSQCSKRYKSHAGLTSHVAKEHIRTADAGGHSAPMSPAPPIEQKAATQGGMRPIASQPQLSSLQQGYQPTPVALGGQGSVSHPAPNIQVRQLPPPISNEQGQVAYQQFQEYPANQPTGAVLQAHLAQRRAQLNAQFGGQGRIGSRTSSFGSNEGGNSQPSHPPGLQTNPNQYPQQGVIGPEHRISSPQISRP